jgi:protein TonB
MAVPTAQPVATGPVMPPRPVAGMETNRAPIYPEIARRRGEQGRVVLRVNISPEGAPLEVDVAATSGYPILDSAALAAVHQWRFIPATQTGVPVAAVAEIPIHFQLSN